MSAITHARTRIYPQVWELPGAVRDAFEGCLEDATQRENTAYFVLHREAAHILGLPIPESGEFAICTCRCGCQRIHDAHHTAIYSHGNGTETAQCPDCADDHRIND